ncbi:MAG: DUF362 domain-containing protein [Nitrospirae bacterium]|nr:DUF362 domain-containing protein [Nitrospirota bacterium]
MTEPALPDYQPKPSVSLIRCKSYDRGLVEASVRRAVALLGGADRFVRPGDRVLLKPNMLSGKAPNKAVTTHPEVVRAVVRLVKEAGGIPSIGDSNALGSFAKVSEVTGMARVARDEGAELVELSEAVDVHGKGKFKHFELSKAAMEADVVINLPKAKTHGQMLLTLAVKNLFGCIPGRRKAQWHFKAGVDREAFATMLVELSGLVRPCLSIIDAVVGMEGNGPGSGTPREVGLIGASADPHALDMVMASVLGVTADRLPTLKAARGLGLIPRSISEIELAGDFGNPAQAAVRGFRLPSESSLEWSIPEPVRRLLKESLTTKPRIHRKSCKFCLMCQTACPVGAITEGRDGMSIDYRQCIRCFCCQEVCPVGAIDIAEGWLLRYLG